MQLNRVSSAADHVPIRNALFSVADKSGLEPFVERLWAILPDLVIYSTGGTFALLERIAARIALEGNSDPTHGPLVRTISSYTGQPEMQGGLVKTLDYKVYLSLLSEQYNADHQVDLERTGAIPFDLTVCSLYPFESVATEKDATLEDLRAHIDIGGPTMVRASAKNFLRVLTVCRPGDYEPVLEKITEGNGSTTLSFRLEMAIKAFRYTARYEEAIAESMERVAHNIDLSALYPERRNSEENTV